VEAHYQWDTGHDKGHHKGSQSASLSSIVKTRPSEDVEVAGAVHVSGIDSAGSRIDEIIADEHLVPTHDKIDIDVVGNS